MITADQIVCALVGDYVLQSDWMAQRKTQSLLVALAHAAVYALPFLFLTQNPAALAVIIGTHAVIDRWRLARFVCWFKNLMSPPDAYADGSPVWWHRWADCTGTGYHKDSPPWLSVWLMIIADNVMHIVLNGLALRWWP